MKLGRVTRRNSDPEPLIEVGQWIRSYLGEASPDRAAESAETQPGPDERKDEASEPEAERSPESETARPEGSEELAEHRVRRPTQSETGLERQTAQLAEQEAAPARAAEERAHALAAREAALHARKASLADLAAEQSRLQALEHELAERNERLERRAAELTEREARLGQLALHAEGELAEPPTRAPAHLHLPRRPIALAVLGIATLALGVFVAVAVVVLTRPPARTTRAAAPQAVTRTVVIPAPPAPASPRRTGRKPPAATLVSRAQTPVLVLNGNGISGAAASTAGIVRARGYPVTATGDAPRRYAQSVVMYKRGFAGEAARLGRDLNVPTLQPLDPLVVPGGTRARLVLIVGRRD